MIDYAVPAGIGVGIYVALQTISKAVNKMNGNGPPSRKLCLRHAERLSSLESDMKSITSNLGRVESKVEKILEKLD